ncbi:hypothetical protein F5Y16DRAFT_381993 [Xylariaceae sp. FL0255]|nr:hypothetical protein F5Y16DRAFT_381993 [Xylariaceae sp. FL0255]
MCIYVCESSYVFPFHIEENTSWSRNSIHIFIPYTELYLSYSRSPTSVELLTPNMMPEIPLDIFYEISTHTTCTRDLLRLCQLNKATYEFLYPYLLRLDHRNTKYRLSLWAACEQDNTSQLRRIYDAAYPDFKDYVTTRPNDFNFWLQYTLTQGENDGLKCLEMMLELGAENGFTPSRDTLSAAVEQHNVKAVEILLEYGAPLVIPRREFIWEHQESGPLFRARSVAMVRLLLAKGADPLEEYAGKNLLHWYCSESRTSPLLLETLIAAGVPIDELDNRGFNGKWDNKLDEERLTPLGFACQSLNLPAMHVLLRHGADPRGADIYKQSDRLYPNRHKEYMYIFPTPLELVLKQDIGKEKGHGDWYRCPWKMQHISEEDEKADEFDGGWTAEYDTEDRVWDKLRILRKGTEKPEWAMCTGCGEFPEPPSACGECSVGFWKQDLETSVDDKDARLQEVISLRLTAWTRQMTRVAHRYLRCVQLLLEHESFGGKPLVEKAKLDLLERWGKQFVVPTLRNAICYSPYGGYARDYAEDIGAVRSLLKGVAQWDLVSKTFVCHIKYLMQYSDVYIPYVGRPPLHRDYESGLDAVLAIFEHIISKGVPGHELNTVFNEDENIGDMIMSGAPIGEEYKEPVDLDACIVEDSVKDKIRMPMWAERYGDALVRDRNAGWVPPNPLAEPCW